MTLSAEVAGMVRLAASAALIVSTGLAVGSAVAGDRALIAYIGYSSDGRYFAFEEFGIQDGSGFPYSNIYFVDLVADKWVAGTPIKVRLDDDGANVEEARDSAYEQARGALDELSIFVAAHEIALNGDGDPRTGDGRELGFGQPGYGLSEMPNAQTLNLETLPREPGEDCAIIDDEVFGFSLSLDGELVYSDDETLPRSRGCAMGYKIYSVVRPAEWSMAASGTLAVIASYPFGFEGPDRRFLVVPLGQ